MWVLLVVLSLLTTNLDGLWEIRAKGTSGWRSVWVPSAFETALAFDFDGVEVGRRVRGWTRFRWEFPGEALCDGAQELVHR
ncbi:MAG: hypothetical protein QGG14_00200 [Planctomycetota bacterium]|jgi:hypothetical protein|nr:hypothetical protein [Planctomycetota bacterium]